MNTTKKKKNYSNQSFCEKKFNFILLSFGIFFYTVFFSVAYFAPLYFPNVFTSNIFLTIKLSEIQKFPFLLHIQLITFLTIVICGIISLFKTVTQKLSTIPNSEPWKLKNGNLSPQERIETEALRQIQIEERLKNNGNKLLIPKKIEEEYDIKAELLEDNSSTNSNTNSNANSISVDNSDFITINQRDIKDGVEELRYCSTCEKLKPDRAHHCKYCNECYLKLDHHCFWLDKCISFDNYKYFFLTVFYGNLFLILFDSVFIRVSFNVMKLYGAANAEFLCLAIMLILINIFAVFSFMLMFFHFTLIIHNYTSFEYSKLINETEKNENFYFEIDKNVDSKEKYFNDISLFDVGKYNNFKQVFGNNPFLWFIPVSNDMDDNFVGKGLCYEINEQYADEVIGYL